MFFARRRTLLAASAMTLLFGIAIETVATPSPYAGPGPAWQNAQLLTPRDR